MSKKPSIILGENHIDERGIISFINTFRMDEIKRFYIISPKNTDIVRAWQAHTKEEKWFHVLNGCFLVVLVEIDDWNAPSDDIPHQEFVLHANKNQVLHIPSGYANGFIALEKDAKLLVFSNSSLEESAHDDFRFDSKKWYDWTKNNK
jgi:dTDP-4-dehydrorhamnose 3,5-epimerase-like enzyme